MDDTSSQVDVNDHNDGPDHNNHANGGPIRRACDACRARKIRCNRESPCSHCLHSKIECTHADNRPKEKRTRILLTSQYERKIDLIDRRLDGVIRLLEDLKVNWPPNSSQTPQTKREPTINIMPPSAGSTPSGPPPSTVAMNEIPADPVVEGESSLAAHSVFASELLKKVVNTESLQEASLELRDTLDSLSHIVSSLKEQPVASEMTYPNAVIQQRQRHASADLPPLQQAVALIRAAKSKRLAGISWIYEFMPMKRFPDTCLNVYLSEEHSEAEYIIVNAGLYSLAEDYASAVEGDEAEEYKMFGRQLRCNLETSLANLPLHLPATTDMVVALVFGAFYAMEISKPSLSWVLMSKASDLCQTLGWHRASILKSGEPEDVELKQFVFWAIYFLDKSLSLRLGRSSTIPDWDISVPPPGTSDANSQPLIDYFVLWIRSARCQGKIYELLYSPDATSQPEPVRQSRVQSLVREMEVLAQDIVVNDRKYETPARELIGSDLMDFFTISDEVLRLSMLTLIHRAAPRVQGSTTTFNYDCIRAARATLEKHQDCVVVMRKTNGVYFSTYINWTLLFAPFIPFIVIFCNVIETQDQNDLQHLQAFVSSIQSAPTVSDAAGKMHRLFQVLFSVALRYVEFHVSTPPESQMQASAEMDQYLAALGFPSATPGGGGGGGGGLQQPQQPNGFATATPGQPFTPADGMADESMADAQRTAYPMMWMGNSAQLEDWFYSNQAMMGLVSQPNFDFPNQN